MSDRRFENAQIGNRVYSKQHGWGTIARIYLESSYPLLVRFDSGKRRNYTLGGKRHKNRYPDLYWDELFIPGSAFRKKPIEIEATQWFRNGDHPMDNPTRGGTTPNGEYWEGEVVRYYRHPDKRGELPCEKCSYKMYEHGWIDTLEGGHIVCPGDYIVTGIQGERYPIKENIFKATYEPAYIEMKSMSDELLREIITTLKHAEIFISSRQKMRPDGKKLHRKLIERLKEYQKDGSIVKR